MRLMNVFWLAMLWLGWTSCTAAPQEIRYGEEQCNFCRMNIVDKRHAAQYVTEKGKQFKFDAIECMVNDMASKPDLRTAHVLVACFDQPGQMKEADQAFYLISEGVPSPMGANLSAFSSEEVLEAMRSVHGGEAHDWEDLPNQIR